MKGRKEEQKVFNQIITNFIEFYKHTCNGKIKKFNGGWLILCPYHSDHDPSLAVYKNGFSYCFSCKRPYKLSAVMSSYGYEHESDETREIKVNAKPVQDAEIIDEKWFLYTCATDPDSVKVYFRLRIDFVKNGERCKNFYFYEPAVENNKQILKLVKGFVPMILYHLPEIEDEKEVFYVEGEKCADALWGLGIPATTLPIGASTKINGEMLKALLPLRNKKIFILPDNDEQGKKYSKSIAKALKQLGADPEIAYIPDLGDKTDVADYIEFLRLQGFTDEKIRREILNLTKGNCGISFDQIEAKPTEWCIQDWIPKGKLTILAGREGVGKTRLALVLACAKANGSPVFTANGFKEVEQGVAFYFSLEDDPKNLASWCDAVGLKRSPNMKVFETESFYEVKNKIKKYKPELAIIDPASYLISEEKSLEGVKPILEPLVSLAKENNIAIVAVWHLNKRETSDVGLAVSGHSRITAMAKRLIVLEKQENKITVHFRKIKNTESVAFFVDDEKFEWVGGNNEEFGSHIPQGEKIAKLIKQELEKSPNRELPFNEIIRMVSPFGITKNYLSIIKDRYLRGVISKPVRKNGKFIGWVWSLPDLHEETVNLDGSLDNQGFSPDLQIIKFLPQQELTVKNSLKINDLQTQEKNNCKKTETVNLDGSLDNQGFSPDLHKKTVNLAQMAKKNQNSLNNKAFFSLKVPVISEWLLKKYKIEKPELYGDPNFRMFAIGHIVNHSKQKRPDGPEKLPIIVIDGKEYIDADELFKMEGVKC